MQYDQHFTTEMFQKSIISQLYHLQSTIVQVIQNAM